MYRLLNPLGIAASQLAVFQGASEEPVSGSYRSSESRGKQPTGRGLVLKWVGCFVARQSRIDPDRLLPHASQTTNFERNETQGIYETVH
jgi:hypothetical protein